MSDEELEALVDQELTNAGVALQNVSDVDISYTFTGTTSSNVNAPEAVAVTVETTENHTEEENNGIEDRIEESNSESEELNPNSVLLPYFDANSRFSGAEWFDKASSTSITIAGLGGIGSWLAILLARTGIDRIRLYDFDDVESANQSGQFYSLNDVGIKKSDAIADKIIKYTTMTNVYAIPERLTIDSEITPIFFCGFDNMEARKTAFNNWIGVVNKLPKDKKREALFVDGRLNAEEFQIFCITGDDKYSIYKYNDNFLFDDREAEGVLCSYKQTSFCAAMIASFMTNVFVNFLTNINNPIIERDLPFFTSYDAKFMILKTRL